MFKACIVKKNKTKQENTLLLISQSSQYFAQVDFCHVRESCVKPSYVTDVKETGVSAGCRWGALWMCQWTHHPGCCCQSGRSLCSALEKSRVAWRERNQNGRVDVRERRYSPVERQRSQSKSLQTIVESSLEARRSRKKENMTDTLLPNGIKDGGGERNYFRKVSHLCSLTNILPAHILSVRAATNTHRVSLDPSYCTFVMMSSLLLWRNARIQQTTVSIERKLVAPPFPPHVFNLQRERVFKYQ